MSLTKKLSILCVPLLLAGCLSSDNDDAPNYTPPTPSLTTADLRVVHASPDAPSVNILINGNVLGGLRDVDYQVGSGILKLLPNTYPIAVNANLPSGTADVLTLDAALDGDMTYNVLAIGSVAAGTLDTLVVANPTSPVSAGTVRAQVVHAAPMAPTVDVYVTAPNTDIASEQALATLAYQDFTGQVEVPAGDYQIRITPAGDTTVVFDSGTLSLSAGADLLITATQNVAAGMSPVALVVADGNATSTLLSADTPAAVRAIHAVADAPAVDIIANNALTLVDGAPFKGVTDYLSVDAGTYLIDIAADADNNVVVIDDASISLEAGKFYTALANNQLANIDLDLIVDMPRAIATAAQVRIFHASQATPAVDIYVTADGSIDDVDPAFSNVPYVTGVLAETGYVQLPAGDYVVTVTPTGTKTEALETGVLSLEAGKIYTAFAVDGDMPGDAPQLILADDFVN